MRVLLQWRTTPAVQLKHMYDAWLRQLVINLILRLRIRSMGSIFWVVGLNTAGSDRGSEAGGDWRMRSNKLHALVNGCRLQVAAR